MLSRACSAALLRYRPYAAAPVEGARRALARGFAAGGGLGESTHPPEGNGKPHASYMLYHPVYHSASALERIEPRHRVPRSWQDTAAHAAVTATRFSFDAVTGYAPAKPLSTEQWLNRAVFLETVAGVPGMVAGVLRHMRSLRGLKRDHGWIHTLLEEAENERMHLLTFLTLKQPGRAFRAAVLLTQGVFFNAFFLAYVVSPSLCHRFVGYLEEEAVKTYTHMLHDIDTPGSAASIWAHTPAPDVAVHYWKLSRDATMRDVIAAIRADEACHAHVNHTFSSMAPDQDNPFEAGHTGVPDNFVEPPPGFVPAREAGSFEPGLEAHAKAHTK